MKLLKVLSSFVLICLLIFVTISCQTSVREEKTVTNNIHPDWNLMVTVNFQFGSAWLSKASRKTLLEILPKIKQYLAEDPGAKLIIEGHTDAVGSLKNNKIESYRRARNVFNFYAQNGVPKSRMKKESFNYQKLIKKTKKKSRVNRRAYVYIKSSKVKSGGSTSNYSSSVNQNSFKSSGDPEFDAQVQAMEQERVYEKNTKTY